MKNLLNILFIGTSEFAVKPLELLCKQNYNIAAVLTRRDKTGGRGKKLIKSPVKEFAEKNRLNIIQPENINSSEVSDFIKNKDIHLGIVISYGGIIKKDIFSAPKYGTINVHPSLLPKYRGPSPIQSSLLHGDEKTGVSVIEITDKMDAGPILLQEEEIISINDNYFSLHDKLSEKGGELLLKYLINMEKTEKKYQNDNEATYCNLIKKEHGLINWEKDSFEIHNQIRAFVKWPVAFTLFKGKILKIYTSKYSEDSEFPEFSPGSILKLSKKKFGVVCGDGKLLEILKLQLQGKKMLDAHEFLNGMNIETGEMLG